MQQRLMNSMETGNMDEAFRAAHTLKGVCQNLSITAQLTNTIHRKGIVLLYLFQKGLYVLSILLTSP